MKPAIYIETTIVSYIAARPSREPFLLGCQRLTRRWWREKRRGYELFTSRVVAAEAARGDARMAARRLGLVSTCKLLETTPEAAELAAEFWKKVQLPANAVNDATHIALAAVSDLDYVLTWNCTHIANPDIARILSEVCDTCGYKLPSLVTPMNLLMLP